MEKKVAMDGARSPKEKLEAAGFKLYVDQEVLDAAPGKDDTSAELVLFKPGKYLTSDEALDEEFESRGLVPASLFALAAAHEADKELANQHRFTATHWKDADGEWCYAAFRRWRDGGRSVSVGRSAFDWYDFWVVAGVRK